MSSSTPDPAAARPWSPAVWPTAADAVDELSGWLADRYSTLALMDMDLRGANLDGLEVTEDSYLNRSNLTGVSLRRADLYRADFGDALLQSMDFSGSFLRNTSFIRANAGRAVFSRCTLGSAVFLRSNLRHADFTDADLASVMFTESDLTGARFVGAALRRTAFASALDEDSDFTGAGGSVLGTIVVSRAGDLTALAEADTMQWFADRGAAVTVVPLARPRPVSAPANASPRWSGRHIRP